MARDHAPHLLEIALWRFTLDGLEATTTADIAKHAYVGVGTLYRTFATKKILLESVYAHAVSQLQAPLLTAAGQARPSERLQLQLARWWTLSAQVARAQPQVFDFWRLYRAQPQLVSRDALLLGPFAAVPEMVRQALAQQRWLTHKPVPLSVLGASLAGQWTVAVELVLRDEACQAEAGLAERVLEQAYAGWWQGLGLANYMEVAKPVSP
jgi:AcrR family transcriptional regulator